MISEAIRETDLVSAFGGRGIPDCGVQLCRCIRHLALPVHVADLGCLHLCRALCHAYTPFLLKLQTTHFKMSQYQQFRTTLAYRRRSGIGPMLTGNIPTNSSRWEYDDSGENYDCARLRSHRYSIRSHRME